LTCKWEWENCERPGEFDEAQIQSFALVAMGLPLDQVEGLVSRKSETITAQLLRCFSRPNLWGRIKDRLITSCGVSKEETRELSALLERVRKKEANFHAPHLRKSGAKIRVRRPKLSRRKIAHVMALVAQDAGFAQDSTPAERELLRQKILRSLLGQARVGACPTKQVENYQSKLKSRIETVLDCEVVVTPNGSFYRAFDDARVVRWLKTVRNFDAEKGDQVLKQLSDFERLIFGQVQKPNEPAHTLAYLEGAKGRTPNPVYTEKMTVACLAHGLEMDLGLFLDVLMKVGQQLRKPTAQVALRHNKPGNE
jgi:hypothetical protein